MNAVLMHFSGFFNCCIFSEGERGERTQQPPKGGEEVDYMYIYVIIKELYIHTIFSFTDASFHSFEVERKNV
jgi:hypothetical protein